MLVAVVFYSILAAYFYRSNKKVEKYLEKYNVLRTFIPILLINYLDLPVIFDEQEYLFIRITDIFNRTDCWMQKVVKLYDF